MAVRLTFSGTREELLERTLALALGWDHLDNPRRMAEALMAHDRLLEGDDVVKAGHAEYRVVKDE